MKNKFSYYPVLSYISTRLRCPVVEPLVFDPIPLAKLSHDNLVVTYHHIWEVGWVLLGSRWLLPAGAKNAPT